MFFNADFSVSIHYFCFVAILLLTVRNGAAR